ncbi:hypothetical protein ACLB2K_067485 [Fragaria x ananassa]
MAPKVKGYKFGETIAKGYGTKVKKCIHMATGQTVALSYYLSKDVQRLIMRLLTSSRKELIHGMHYFHKRLLDETKLYLKIADFGISNFVSDYLTLSTHCGTEFYQAPEISKDGTRYRGPEVDVYSCGVTLYHLLYGCPSSQNFRSGRFCISEFDTATPDTNDLISRMTEYRPHRRITISEIKGHKWFVDGDPLFLDDPRDAVFDQGIDNDILLETVSKMKCEREDLIQSLIKEKHTEETTTYKRLKKKMQTM